MEIYVDTSMFKKMYLYKPETVAQYVAHPLVVRKVIENALAQNITTHRGNFLDKGRAIKGLVVWWVLVTLNLLSRLGVKNDLEPMNILKTRNRSSTPTNKQIFNKTL